MNPLDPQLNPSSEQTSSLNESLDTISSNRVSKLPLGASPQEHTNAQWDCRLIKAPRLKEKIYKFRYSIYCDELSREKDIADHDSKTITDKLDETALLLGAFVNEEVIGTFRLNLSCDTDLPHKKLFEMPRFEKLYPERVCLASKLMIAPRYRRSLLFFELAKAFYRVGAEYGAGITVMGCNQEAISAFRKVGFRTYKPAQNYTEYGTITPMLFDHEDLNYLVKIRSPLVRNW